MMMKNIKIMMILAALTMVGGCSKDGDGSSEPTWNNSTFTPSEKPTWVVDWHSDAVQPDWQDPDATKYECCMNMRLRLVDDMAPYSTEDDRLAVFINGECRGVSYRSKMANGKVFFLLHINGDSKEAGNKMELRYYCDGLHHMSITTAISPFVPNNVDDIFQSDFSIVSGSQKYPVATSLSVMMPQKMPFTATSGDMLAVFVGDECRGIGYQGGDLYEGWRVTVYGPQVGETGQIRYYSAEKGGVYTILKTFTLSGNLQQENIWF